MAVASDVASLFFPHSQALGIAPDDTTSPAVLRKMVYAGSHATSFQRASKDLKQEAELDNSEQRIMRATKRIGQERWEQRDAAVEAWGKLPWPQRQVQLVIEALRARQQEKAGRRSNFAAISVMLRVDSFGGHATEDPEKATQR